MRNFVVVGCGEHFRQNVGPTLALMERADELRMIATVDLHPLGPDPTASDRRIPHIIRRVNVPLSSQLEAIQNLDPIVMLAHAHEHHSSDAEDLVSAGFDVIIEKPYAISRRQMSKVRNLAETYPRKVALAEYYLMMKASPLLYLAGSLRRDSFYNQDVGYLESLSKNAQLGEFYDARNLIGRPRFILIDILEGEGSTGRFEDRGRQFADSKHGIGVILDLAIHALAPLIALKEWVGEIPPVRDISLQTSACSDFVRFATAKYSIPARRVPETYMELQFCTSKGVQVTVLVGKYVPPDANQRRTVIVGDGGELQLDLTNCILSIGKGESTATALLRAPKRKDSKYRSVLQACMSHLQGRSPFLFDPNEVSLRSNEVTLGLHSRSIRDAAGRAQYSYGALPGEILPSKTDGATPGRIGIIDLSDEDEGTKIYFEHQYRRMESLEDQAFKMSAGVFVVTAAVFTYLSRADMSRTMFSAADVIAAMLVANLIAIAYMWRIYSSIDVHHKRAKAVLESAWPALVQIDGKFAHTFKGRINLRPLIHSAFHVLLVVVGAWALWSNARQSGANARDQMTLPSVAHAPPAHATTRSTTRDLRSSQK
jgi:predicted dehydrogenase